MIFPDYSSYFTYLGPNRKPGPSASVAGNPFMDLEHFQNWIAAVRSRDQGQLNAEIEQGHLSACLPHLALILCGISTYELLWEPAGRLILDASN